MSPVRVAFSYEIVRATGEELLATGRTVHATLDRGGRPARLPDRVRGLFT
jgi:acyl-CoA thioesterase FadM